MRHSLCILWAFMILALTHSAYSKVPLSKRKLQSIIPSTNLQTLYSALNTSVGYLENKINQVFPQTTAQASPAYKPLYSYYNPSSYYYYLTQPSSSYYKGDYGSQQIWISSYYEWVSGYYQYKPVSSYYNYKQIFPGYPLGYYSYFSYDQQYNYLYQYYSYKPYKSFPGYQDYRGERDGPSPGGMAAVIIAVILGVIGTCICSCIGYFWCTKTIVINGRMVRRCACCDKCKKDRTINAQQVGAVTTVIPNLRVGQDGLVYHVDQFDNISPMQVQAYSPDQEIFEESKLSYNNGQGMQFSPEQRQGMVNQLYQQESQQASNFGAYPVLQIQSPQNLTYEQRSSGSQSMLPPINQPRKQDFQQILI